MATTVLAAVVVSSGVGFYLGANSQPQTNANATVVVVTMHNTFLRTIIMNSTTIVAQEVSTFFATETGLSTVTYTATTNLTSTVTTTTTTTNSTTVTKPHHGH